MRFHICVDLKNQNVLWQCYSQENMSSVEIVMSHLAFLLFICSAERALWVKTPFFFSSLYMDWSQKDSQLSKLLSLSTPLESEITHPMSPKIPFFISKHLSLYLSLSLPPLVFSIMGWGRLCFMSGGFLWRMWDKSWSNGEWIIFFVDN